MLALFCAGISSLHAHLGYTGRDFGSFCCCCETNSNNLTVTISSNKVTSDHGWAAATSARFGDSHHLRAFRFRLESAGLAQITIRGTAFSTNPALQYPAFSLYSGLAHLPPNNADFDSATVSTNYMNTTFGAGNWDGCFNPLGTWRMGNADLSTNGTNIPGSLSIFTYIGHAADGSPSNYGTNPGIFGDGMADGIVTKVFKLPIGDYTVMVGDGNASGTNATNTYGFDATLTISDIPERPTESGQVIGWGDNSCGQTNIPSGLTNVVQVAAGDLHSVALCSDGHVTAWGDNSYGQCDVPVSLTNAVQVVAGNGFSAALNDFGQIIVWGDNTYGQTNVPTNCCFARISAGEFHLLGIKGNSGNVITWGDNSYGQATSPTNCCFVEIAAGDSHSLGLGTNGRIIAWGDNAYGQTNLPPGLSNAPIALAAHGYRNIALQSNGTALVWGGVLGGGPRRGGLSGIPGFTNLTSVSAGWYHFLGLRSDRTLIAAGDNTYGQTNAPAKSTNIIQIASGGFHNLALKSSKQTQTVTFTGTTNINLVYGQSAVDLSKAKLGATASSKLPVIYNVQNPSVATISTNGFLTPVGVGTTTISAMQDGSTSFHQAVPVSRTVVVVKGTPVISFSPTATRAFVANTTFPLSASASGSLPVTFSSGNTNVVSVSGSTATIRSKGKVILSASVTGDSNWKSNSATTTITIK